MAKRELYEKKETISKIGDNCIFYSCRTLHPITEEEIVKPYLEKLKAELIAKYPKNVYGTPELGGLVRAFSLKKLLEMIDNLLI